MTATHSGSDRRRAAGFERRLVVLMAARLGLSVVSLVVALAIEGFGGNFALAERGGFYTTVVFAFVATVGYGLVLGRVKRPKRFAAANIATDIAIVSALVHFSGGGESVFTFLYVLVAVYGAILFERRGALISAGVGAMAYGAVLLGEHQGWISIHRVAYSEPRPVLVSMWVIHAGAVLVVAALASLLSIELRRTGQALSERTTDLERLWRLHQRTVESLMSGILTTDGEGRITSFNPEARRITGVEPASALGRPVGEVLPEVGELLGSPVRGPRARARIPYRNRRGEELHLGVAAYVLRDPETAPGGKVLIFQDVTEVVHMEAELRRSERLAAVGRLSASIAHEIRNPLAAISGSIQILQDKLGAPAAAGEPRRLMEIVLRETERLNHLITDFLIYARPGPRNLGPVGLGRAVAEVLEAFDSVRPRNVEVETRIEPSLAVCADAQQLRQVLWNLVLNAAEAMPEGGRLEISAEDGRDAPSQGPAAGGRNGTEPVEKGGGVEITVADEGVGISPEALERVFDPFFTTKRDGSGLGLATVYRIVEEHGGSIRLESSVGSGTRIRLRLPRAETPA